MNHGVFVRSPRERAFAEASQLNARNLKVTVRAIRENAGVSQSIAQEAAKAFSVTRDQIDAGREVPEPLLALTRTLYNELTAEAFGIYGQKLDKRDNELEVLAQENEEIRLELKVSNANLAQMAGSFAEQQSEVVQAQSELASVASKLSTVQAENQLVRAQLVECQSLLLELQTQLQLEQKRYSTATHANELLEQQNNALRDAVVSAAVRSAL